ncbi:biotin--[acetyl-CoA-carboxylase] ligase [Maricaulis sp.]|uniref:biotin--[acetyl-CoA-carboxylase] ligase n=1 Tax=Maricaulis sp. TaxID=1486257 RepID=UPI0025E48A85|nr:biotin--[acetyl-CoA-carboxylase] ligase [Maricaulis sp.]MDF1767273.1 biotin--[acetyl-CoA-carboxylase] ligase [Maricaulis sp.]
MSDPQPRIEWVEETASTNADIKARAIDGERGPLWLAARRQTAGRGRRGRAWSCLTGNLFTTGLYTFQCDPGRAAELSFAAANAVGAVCDAALGDPALTRLKWPNDALVSGRKAAGILLESGPAPGGGLWLAVGIGINLADAPEDVDRPATALAIHGRTLAPDAALDILITAFERERRDWLLGGFGPIRDRWLTRAHGLGQSCEARLENETVRGVFSDLGPDGALRLDLVGGGRRYISAGDVFFPDAG